MANVGKRYDRSGPWVLRGVDLDLPPSSVVRIEGVNGRGKSTLLRVLAGITRPTTGRVTGRPATGYVPERFPPDLPFSAARYLRHMGRVHGLSRADAARRADRWIGHLGLADHAHVPLRRLSKGTSQKVAVAQALLADPGLLVLDEAWTGLDGASRALLDGAALDAARRGARVVFIDHDPARLAGRTTAAYRLDDGRLHPAATAAPDPAAAPAVLIEADDPRGAGAPTGLPGAPRVDTPAPGTVRVTTDARHSDAVLRALLDAPHPLHIRSVSRPGADAPGVPAAPAPREGDR